MALLEKHLLWIRTTAGPSIGFGHLRRSLILGGVLSENIVPVFLCDAGDRWTKESAAKSGWECLTYEPGCLEKVQSPPSGILIDTREEAGLSNLVSWARKLSIPIISIHDLGLNPVPSDIFIDGSIKPISVSEYQPDGTSYLGTDYLILDPAFASYHSRIRSSHKGIASLVVNLGGGDPSRSYEKVIRGLQMWGRPLEVTGVPGFVNWGQKAFSSRNWDPLRFRWLAPDESVARELFVADAAITAGGLSAYEALCTGAPLIAISHDSLQKITIDALADRTACVNLGFGHELIPTELPRTLKLLDESPRLREELSSNGRRIVDGLGAARVSELIRKALQVNAGQIHSKVAG